MTNTKPHERETWPNVANTMQNAKWPCPNVANTMQNGRFWFQTVANTRQMVPGKKTNKSKTWGKKQKLSYTQCLAHQRINMVQSNLNQRDWNTLMRFKQNRTNRKHAQTRSQKQQVLWECGYPWGGLDVRKFTFSTKCWVSFLKFHVFLAKHAPLQNAYHSQLQKMILIFEVSNFQHAFCRAPCLA